MMNIDMRKIYKFQPIEPKPAPENLPTGGDIYYECLDCSSIINSLPYIASACSCGNLEGSDGKLSIKNPSIVQAVRGALK